MKVNVTFAYTIEKENIYSIDKILFTRKLENRFFFNISGHCFCFSEPWMKCKPTKLANVDEVLTPEWNINEDSTAFTTPTVIYAIIGQLADSDLEVI